MVVSRDLQLLLVGLRDRVIDPGRLADAASEWSHDSGAGFISYLAERGVITPNDLQRLESETIDQALHSTPSRVDDPDETTDSPANKSPDTQTASSRSRTIRRHSPPTRAAVSPVWLARYSVDREVALKTLRPDRVVKPRPRPFRPEVGSPANFNIRASSRSTIWEAATLTLYVMRFVSDPRWPRQPLTTTAPSGRTHARLI
jgi:hypothetical protein